MGGARRVEVRAGRRAVALVVVALASLVPATVPAGARPPPLGLQIAAPTAAAPFATHTGGPVAVRFSVDQPSFYEVTYRPAGATGSLAAFPDATGRGRGAITVGVSAPVAPGSYDIAVEVRLGNRTSTAIAPGALTVTGPGVTEAQRCDDLDPAACLLPFPNDLFTGADPSSDTGRLVNLQSLSTPRNVGGKPVDTTEWNRNDGFSPGAMALARVPGLDLHATWGGEADQITDLSWSLRADAPIVLLDADTGARHPYWSELDTHPDTTDDERLLIVRPAVNLVEGHRYIVALRDLRAADGSRLVAGPSFAAYRDRTPGPTNADPLADATFEARRPHMERILTELRRAGVERGDLYLAWDFTVASERNLSERALHLRDDTFAELGDTDLADGTVTGQPPRWQIGTVTEQPDPDTMRRVEGTVTVPNFMAPPSTLPTPHPRLNYVGSDDGLPRRNPVEPTVDVPFVCNLPTGADGSPATPMLYGHGLLGSRTEANGGSTGDLRRRGFAACAMDWWGMSGADIPTVAAILLDVSVFPSLADRAQQGFLNMLYLGRALAHPDGLRTDPAFRSVSGAPLIGTDLVYDGNSQGAIMGGSLVALSPDLERATLGVPGMNYSTLLNRSSDWEPLPGGFAFGSVLYGAYPSKLDQQLLFALIQMLWDRAEANGYAHHLTDDPLAGTRDHQVMLQVAFSDHQVANVSAEVEARTIGARLRTPAVPDGLHWSVDPTFGLTPWHPATEGPLLGESVLVYWLSTDRGLTTPPNGNLPPRIGEDPHEDPRRDDAASDQVAHFLRTGEVVDVCDGGPCLTSRASQ